MKEITWSGVFTQLRMLVQDLRDREVTEDELRQLVKVAAVIPIFRPILMFLLQKHKWTEKQVASLTGNRLHYVYNPDVDLEYFKVDVGLMVRDGVTIAVVGDKEYPLGEIPIDTVSSDDQLIQVITYNHALKIESDNMSLSNAKFAECDRVIKRKISHFDILSQRLFLALDCHSLNLWQVVMEN